jgi:hypothetical protein
MMKVILCVISLLVTVNLYADEPIKLESQFVGDKEQPAVSYFMSWQGPGSTENLYRKEEDKYEKNIDTVDRDVMLRSMRIYDEMNLEGR